MNRLRFIHLFVGTLGLVAFALTGQYMHWVHEHLRHIPDGPRLLYRSAHIYLLWSSLLNVVLGCYGQFSEGRAVRVVQGLASLAILVGPVLLLVSFTWESHAGNLARPIGRLAIFMAFAGVLVHAACTLLSRAKRRT